VTNTAPVATAGDVTMRGVAKAYGRGTTRVRALTGIDLDLVAGEFVVVLGPSGSGKTTLLNLIGALDVPSEGRVQVGDDDLGGLDDRARTRFRRDRVGFVFQFFNLIPTLTAEENVRLAADLVTEPRDVTRLLQSVGLTARAGHFPGQLSGGDQQRVAVARALVKNPSVILADEPTGSLDSATGAEVLALLKRLAEDEGRTVVLVTHDASIAERADRVLTLADGRIVDDRLPRSPARGRHRSS
jgi:putative ABC transport system ATP-binding protein